MTKARSTGRYSTLPFTEAVERHKLEMAFPYIAGKSYKITSSSAREYNCFAWAAEDDTRRWLPETGPTGEIIGGFYWPDGVPMFVTVWTLEQLYDQALGYEACDDGDHVIGLQKIAIYGYDRHNATHVARQTARGTWLSKMGPLADIEHDNAGNIVGGTVAKVQSYMRRPSSAAPRLAANSPQLLLPMRAGS